MKFFTKEVKIALVAIVAIVVLFFGMQFLKGLNMFNNGNSYLVCFDDITGMSTASPVYVNGYKVGVVERLNYDYDHPENVVAVIGVNKDMKLPKGTYAEIVGDLLGNCKVVLRLGDVANGMLGANDTITGGQQKGMLGKVGEMVPTVEQLLPKLDSILASVNALLADPALRNSLTNIEEITGNLTTTTNELHRLSAALNQSVPGLMTKADGVLDNTQQLTANLSAIDVASTMAKVNTTLTNVEQLTARLNSNEGTFGLLMRDEALYRNLNATVSHADSLMIDLKQHPKRYVHFSVFGKKDK